MKNKPDENKNGKLANAVTLLIVATLAFGTIYATNQQNLRQSANDPQIQNAEDIAMTLSSSPQGPPESPQDKTNLEKSLSPFTMVFDGQGKNIYTSAELEGNTPSLPKNVLEDAKNKGEVRFTWEPKKGVRLATVVKSYKGTNSGVVVTGRSLRETEKREKQLLIMTAAGWGASVLTILIGTLLLPWLAGKGKKR